MSGSPEDYAAGVAAGLIDPAGQESPGPSNALNAKVKELAEKIRSADGERLRVAEARVAELEGEVKGSRAEVERLGEEVMSMHDAFGRCRSILGLGDCDDMPSVVRRVSMLRSELAASQSEVKRLGAVLEISVGTNSRLLTQLRDESKEGGA